MKSSNVETHRHSPSHHKSWWRRMFAFMRDRELYHIASATGECAACGELLLAPNADCWVIPFLTMAISINPLVRGNIIPFDSPLEKTIILAAAVLLILLSVFLRPFILAVGRWKPIELGGRDKKTVIEEYRRLRRYFSIPMLILSISFALVCFIIGVLYF